MAAASGELPPAATREKKDPSFAESSPAVPAMAAGDGWSTLPGDLVRRIADSFLDDNNLDWYMDYRAICTGWRAATDDPRSEASDARFRPSRWIVLDEAFHSQGNLLLLNTVTGRFLRKNFPQLGDHESFVRYNHKQPLLAYDFFRKAVVGGVYASFSEASVVREMIICLGKFLPVDLAPVTEVLSLDLPGHGYGMRCFLVDLHGHICIVMKIMNPHGVSALFALQYDTETSNLCLLKTPDRYAIFIGDHRCFSVDVDEFPGTEPDCVYYTEHIGSSAHICKCNIKDNKMERISEAADFVKQDKKFVLVADRPYTIIHLLASYTINNPDSQLALQQIP
ncbi:uncharacterized protein LOC125547171 [Triticum urartu]|uniref:uncharacterized protein LOC125547171 n=1 Tax=Triticum urartu TaxID=4572 RepID=UPI0020448257|nr:uncharacterized protein LOC125547171 [Triticum urartu]